MAPGAGLLPERGQGSSSGHLPASRAGSPAHRGGPCIPALHGQIQADSHVFPSPICFYFPSSKLLLVNWRMFLSPFLTIGQRRGEGRNALLALLLRAPGRKTHRSRSHGLLPHAERGWGTNLSLGSWPGQTQETVRSMGTGN